MPSCSGAPDAISRVFEGFAGNYAIHISKKDFTFDVYDRQLNRVASFRIGYGLNPDGGPKLHAGDNRTPEGLYTVTEILSMDADRSSEAYRKLRDMNSVYFRARDGHYKYGFPEKDLGDNAYGPRFFRLGYPGEHDIRRYDEALKKGAIAPVNGTIPGIGSGIAIHGNADEASIGRLSSSGCVRLFNSDVVLLDRYIIMGTPVLITGK
jgi:murein L,D-transpeptidase YafK